MLLALALLASEIWPMQRSKVNSPLPPFANTKYSLARPGLEIRKEAAHLDDALFARDAHARSPSSLGLHDLIVAAPQR